MKDAPCFAPLSLSMELLAVVATRDCFRVSSPVLVEQAAKLSGVERVELRFQENVGGVSWRQAAYAGYNSQKHETKGGWGQSYAIQGHGARSKILIQLTTTLCVAVRQDILYIHAKCIIRSLLDYTLLPGNFQTNTKYRLTQRRHLTCGTAHSNLCILGGKKADDREHFR